MPVGIGNGCFVEPGLCVDEQPFNLFLVFVRNSTFSALRKGGRAGESERRRTLP